MPTTRRSLVLVVGMWASLAAAAPAAVPATQPAADPLAQLVAELHARGEPATPEDLLPPKVKPEENAALLYEKAAASLDPKNPRSSNESFSENLPYPPQWHRLAAENVRRNQASFDLVRQAATRPAVAWTPGPDADLLSSLMHNLGKQRALATAVADAALQAHFTGKDRDAILLFREQLRHADAMGKRPALVSKLVMLGFNAISANNAQILSTELTVEDAKHPLRPGVQAPASRAAVQEVIGELLTDSRILAPWRQCFREERVYTISELRRNGLSAPLAAKSLPALSLLYDGYIAAADKPSWACAVATPDDPICKVLAPGFGRAQETVTRTMLVRRMAAISLAVALYRNDRGQFPPDLAALVPQYLPAVPVDPFSRTQQPFQYGIMNGKRPMLGSVGPDGIDAMLPQLGLPANAHYGFYRPGPGEADDVWMDLSAWPGQK